jgi:hypothetical protein
MVFLSLEPSTHTIEPHISPLCEQLQTLEQKLHARGQWRPPAIPPKSPEYSIIDISDLSTAIRILENVFEDTYPPKPLSARSFFSKCTWNWDLQWKEFYSYNPGDRTYIYLDRWRFDEPSQDWQHIGMAGADLQPDAAAEMLGCWEDWVWDPVWKEWYLDVRDEEGAAYVYASKWQEEEDGGWAYVGNTGVPGS